MKNEAVLVLDGQIIGQPFPFHGSLRGVDLPNGLKVMGGKVTLPHQIKHDGKVYKIHEVVRDAPTAGKHQTVQFGPVINDGGVYKRVGTITNQPTARIKAELVQQTKAVAKDKIEQLLPEWKQRNLLARGIELTNKGNKRTAEEDTEVEALQSQWDAIKAIRSASDSIETAINAMTFAELQSYDLKTDARWPS